MTSELGDACTFATQLLLRADLRDDIEPGEPDFPNYSDVSKRYHIDTQADAELRELWLRCSSRHLHLTLGKQQIVWGKSDGLKILDVVNPQSFREFILDEFEDSRIPLWAANIELSLGQSNLQVVYVPDTTYHELPVPFSPYEFKSPRLVPQVPPGVSAVMLPLDKPDDPIDDADWGVRFSTLLGGWDLSLIYLYHYEDLPVLRQTLGSSVADVVIQPTHERTQLYGMAVSNAFGDLTVRAEAGYSKDKEFTSTDLFDLRTDPVTSLVKADELSYVLGLDWYGLTDSLLSFQYFESRLEHEDLPVARPQVDRTVTGLYRWWTGQQRLQLQTIWLHSLEHEDGLVRPSLRFAWSDHGQVTLGYDLFYGDRVGLFGQYRDRDRGHLGLRFDF